MKTNPSQIQHEQLRRLLNNTLVKVRAPRVARELAQNHDAWREFHRLMAQRAKE